VFTTIGCEQEYFLIDEQYYFERPDLLTTGRTLYGAQPRRATSSTTTTLARSLSGYSPTCSTSSSSWPSSACRSRRATTRSRRTSTRSAPIFENSNVGADHQMITMQIMQNTARRYGLICLLHEKPFAGVNGSGKHNNWSMGHQHRVEPARSGDTPRRELAVPVLLCGGYPGRQPPPGAAARIDRERRPGSPSGRQRGAAGDHLDSSSARSSRRCSAQSGRQSTGLEARLIPGARHAGPAATAAARRRSQPHQPIRIHRQQFEFRALGSSSSPAFPNTVLNTIVAESVDELAGKLKDALKGSAATLEKAVTKVVKDVWSANKQIVFDGDGYSEAWHKEAEKRGLANLRTHPRRAAVARRETDG